jgi:hypothetical protein
MEFMDKRCDDGEFDTDNFGRRTHQFEIIPNLGDEYEVLHGAMSGLASNILTGRCEPLDPTSARVMLGYFHDHAKNPKSLTMSPGRAMRFAQILEISLRNMDDEEDKEILSGVIGAIATEADVRSLGLSLELNSDVLLAE